MLEFFLTTLITAISLLVVDLAVPGVAIATEIVKGDRFFIA